MGENADVTTNAPEAAAPAATGSTITAAIRSAPSASILSSSTAPWQTGQLEGSQGTPAGQRYV